MKSKVFVLAVLLSLICNTGFAVVSPSSVKIKIFGVSVSASADCSNPVIVFTSTTGTEVDFVSAPTLGSGDPADGSYQCVMITMSDNIKATPATTEGNCVSGEETSGGVCQSFESTDTLDGATLASTASCTDGEDRVTLYLHTGTTRTSGGNAFRKPVSTTDTSRGFKLDGAFVVAGTSVGTFVADFTNRMQSGGGECGLLPPLFGFR